MAKWNIQITDFLGGFAPAWYNQGSYPSYGNKNHAGDMANIDLTAPNFLTQGPGLANLTNGTQAGAVTTLISSITKDAYAADVAFAIGGNLLHKISSTTVIDDATWPHTIDKGAVTGETGSDTIIYQDNLYYTYNHTLAGDIGKYNLGSTFDDDWGSTVPSGAATLDGTVSHPMEVGGNDKLYIGNGRYICSYDGTTLIPQALDFPSGTTVVSLRWNAERLYATANRSDLSGSNRVRGSIYLWDGTTTSWEAEIVVSGKMGGSYIKNGTFFFFYQDISSSGGYKLAYLDGSTVVDVANFTGALPTHFQVTEYKDFILWVSSALLFAYGAGDKDLPVRLFQLADGGYSTVGALACPFGTPMVASFDGATNYKLAKFSGYDTACTFKTLLFDVTGETGLSRLNTVVWNFEQLASGASLAWSLVNNKGATIYSDTISYAKLGAATSFVAELNGKLTDNLRVQLDFSGGSTSNPVKVKSISIYGSSNQ